MTDPLMERARALGLHGIVAHWDDIEETGWLSTLIDWEEEERRSRSLKRRLADARLGQFKPLAEFDWDWPRRCDRMAVEDLMTLDFLKEAANLVLVGPNGVGKSTIAANIAYRAVLQAIPCASQPPQASSASSLPSTAIPCSSAGCASTPGSTCWSSTRSDTSHTARDSLRATHATTAYRRSTPPARDGLGRGLGHRPRPPAGSDPRGGRDSSSE